MHWQQPSRIIWSAATSAARCTSPPACAGAASRYRCCILWRCWRNSGRVVSERRIDPQHQEFGELALDEFAQALFLRSEEHTSELQSLMRISYAVFCLKNKK